MTIEMYIETVVRICDKLEKKEIVSETAQAAIFNATSELIGELSDELRGAINATNV